MRKRNPFGETEEPIWGFDGETRIRRVQEYAIYAAMVEAMDQAVGKVLDELDRQKLTDNTIVIITSDNGGLSTGDLGISADQGWPTSNLPLRAGKGWLYEGGIRVPLIVKAPGVTAAGTRTDAVMVSQDFYPTLLELVGLEFSPEQHADGISMVPALRGEPLRRPPAFWHYPHYGNQGGSPGSVVRDGQWKLIEWYEDQSLELYDLEADPGESNNLAQTAVGQRQKLHDMLVAWRKKLNVKMPTKNTANQGGH